MREQIQQLIEKWQDLSDILTEECAEHQEKKELALAVQKQGKLLALKQCILDLYDLLNE